MKREDLLIILSITIPVVQQNIDPITLFQVAGKIIDTLILPYLPRLEDYVKRTERNGFVVGGSLSKADIVVFDLIKNLKRNGFPLDLEQLVKEKYPTLNRVSLNEANSSAERHRTSGMSVVHDDPFLLSRIIRC